VFHYGPRTDVQILNGEDNGKLAFSLPRTPDNLWPLEVVLMAPGLEFTRGTTPASSIVLPLKGNAITYTRFVPTRSPDLRHDQKLI
jgi:hypothetical protein